MEAFVGFPLQAATVVIAVWAGVVVLYDDAGPIVANLSAFCSRVAIASGKLAA
jgi:hypothetical protein